MSSLRPTISCSGGVRINEMLEFVASLFSALEVFELILAQKAEMATLSNCFYPATLEHVAFSENIVAFPALHQPSTIASHCIPPILDYAL